MKIKLLIIFILYSCICVAQEHYDKSSVSKKVQKLARKIEKVNVLMGSAVGYAGNRPQQYNNYEAMIAAASDKELAALTNHPNGVVRCYAFEGLCERKKEDKQFIFNILQKHINDEEGVENISGCIESTDMTGDIMISNVTYPYYESGEALLDSLQINAINILLIQSKSKLYHREIAIEALPPSVDNYQLVKNLVSVEKNETALIKLSEYKKEEDLNIFLTYYKTCGEDDTRLQTVYKIALNFPHTAFFKLLRNEVEKIQDDSGFSQSWESLYTAISSYKNQEAYEVLLLPFGDNVNKQIQKYHLDFIEKAINYSPDSIYDPLLWKLWDEYNCVIIRDFIHLKSLDAFKSYELSKKSLDTELVPFKAGTKDFYLSAELQSIMVKDIMEKDKLLAQQYIIRAIEVTNIGSIKAYLKIIESNKESVYVAPLFKRLITEDNPQVYLGVIETLISYNQKEINTKIPLIRKDNPAMNKGWGSNNLDELLEKYNIH